jgi:hypothetical protein
MKPLSLLLLGALVACGPSTNAPDAKVPCTFVSENEDAWLHEHCQLAEVRQVSGSQAVDEAATQLGGNFVEIIGVREKNSVVKVFRCANKPTWYVANRYAPVMDER